MRDQVPHIAREHRLGVLLLAGRPRDLDDRGQIGFGGISYGDLRPLFRTATMP
jgi:hypothetical protein